MQAHTVERVESWNSRPFSGGVRELHDLADADFSGAVVADDTWLFMLNGRVVGVFEGDLADFDDADGTVYRAPDPSVALLFSMQERGGETQAKYYTNDTPVSEADATLSEANFTGYIELSENVLSGDYYVVYHGGRSMSAAYVGASDELVTGDDAFERADDEVGVYEVRKTPVNVTSLPEVEDDDSGAAAGAGASGAGAGGAAAAGAAAGSTADSDEEPGAGSETGHVAGSGAETGEQPDTNAGAEVRSGEEAGASADEPETGDGDGATIEDAEPDAESRTESTSDSRRADANAARPEGSESDTGGERDSTGAAAGAAAGAAGATPEDGVFDEEKEWQNARSIPTLDPEQSASSDGGTEGTTNRERTRKTRAESGSSKRAESEGGNAEQSGPRSTVEKLKQAVKQRDAKLEDAAERIETLRAEREELRETVEEATRERDELEARVAELEAELEAVQPDQPEGDVALDPSEALSGTNLFVRYGSKGKPTLDGLDASTDADAVNKNLRIDHHTQFDVDRATVNGDPFVEFLEETGAYRFVSWAVRELPYEVRDAGHEAGLSDLYEAIPAIDRAELDGTVEVETEDGSVSETFDVVLRDRMGNALVVADMNAEREPVTGPEMEALVDAATDIREGSDDLGAAMCVTASFFEPPALEVADEETGGGGFLGRSDKESFVTVGRKAGYHLCLVEDRNDAFHVTVPEL